VLEYDTIESETAEAWEATLTGFDSWIAFNVSTATLPMYADVAAKV
jgi:hypothetical protein